MANITLTGAVSVPRLARWFLKIPAVRQGMRTLFSYLKIASPAVMKHH